MRPEIEETFDRNLCYGKHAYIGLDTSFYQINGIGINFQTLTSSGLKRQGDRISALFSTQGLAEDAFDKQVKTFLEMNPGDHILWRMPPHAEKISLHQAWAGKDGSVTLEQHDYWYVVSRLAVSHIPPRLGPQEEL